MRNTITQLIAVLLVMAGSMACENSFEPLQKNEKYVHSIYGALDVHADTQWVRVMPIGDRLFNNNPEHDGTSVTLTRLSTGSVYPMHPRRSSFGGPSHVWNYWTAEPIMPMEPYLLTAVAPDGRTSEVMVTTPDVLPEPDFEYNHITHSGNVSGFTEQKIVITEVKYHVQVIFDLGVIGEEQIEKFSTTSRTSHNPVTRIYRFMFEGRQMLSSRLGVSPGSIIINAVEIQVVVSNGVWPDYTGLTPEEMTMPDINSNVKDGTGFVATAASRSWKHRYRDPIY